ncbi:MAG TPA: hypothetical protein VFH78_14710 [Candidatus Thermoplasmatota archaeon]|nr:hypothetical protein [Candidatus Thermoplasmatota archaeon]
MSLPKRYVVAIAIVGLLTLVPALAYMGVPPFNNTAIFLGVNAASFFILLLFGVFGGAFVGMVLAHRILANREFTPYERTVIESLAEIRDRLDALEKRSELLDRKP